MDTGVKAFAKANGFVKTTTNFSTSTNGPSRRPGRPCSEPCQRSAGVPPTSASIQSRPCNSAVPLMLLVRPPAPCQL